MPPRPKSPKTVFGKRLLEARLRAGLPQDRVGVAIGLDEGSASARMSRYEAGVHEPSFDTSKRIAEALGVPHPYLYCDNDDLADLILLWHKLSEQDKRGVKEFVNSLVAN
ncbi:helix-turn-helix transcriptional regulator [Comamonas antarctica]|uniref:helix-turn-helix domain-containing protein n=1 Tax=Comamonas antarctica TaxID=2743470 RepID=UPI0028EEB24A|nr:helix-turn-helix transcriptional regulator [Comamonas antarctica]